MTKVEQIWNKILGEIEKKVSAVCFDVWIKTIEPVCLYKNSIVLYVPTEATLNIITKRYADVVKDATNTVFPSITGIEYVLYDQLPAFEKYKETEKTPEEKIEATPEEFMRFVPDYNFDNFVKGKSNEFALAVSKAVAEKPGKKYNPLFLHGGVGLGKTHLMHAIGNYCKAHHPELNVIYVTSERFTNDYIESIGNTANDNACKEFRDKYREADLLMIDDIQFIAKKTSTQEEVFHTFNDLYLKGHQIILSSDRPPKEIPTLEERLRTRFESGIVAEINPPDLEMRIAILQNMCVAENVTINKDILQIIAEKVTSNIRDLKGLLSRVISYANLMCQDCNNLEMVLGALKDYADDEKEIVTMDIITEKVCEYFGIDKKDLVGKKRNKEVVYPRQVAAYLMCEFLAVPLETIGMYFDRDHTTISHSRDKISAQIKESLTVANQVKDIKNSILKR